MTKRSVWWSAAWVLAGAVAPAAGQEPEAAGAAAPAGGEAALVLGELQATNRRLEAMERELARLAGILEEEHGRDNGPDLAALREVKLPPDATREQVDRYISDLAVITDRQRSTSNDDPQVTMLADAGRRDLLPLIEAIGLSERLDRHLIEAIGLVAVEGQKGLIIEHLARRPELLQVVLSRRWVADARDVILAEAENGRGLANPRWLGALAELDDPAAEALLAKALTRGPNRANTFRMLEHRPGLDLASLVAAAWDAAKVDQANERAMMAPIAVRYGHEDALAVLVDALPQQQPQMHPGMWHGPAGDARSTVLIHLDFYGSNDEIRAWYRENRGRLRFDPQKRRFTTAPSLSRAAGRGAGGA